MRFGTNDRAAQPDIERARLQRRRRIQLTIMRPSELATLYRRTCRENPGLVALTDGLPQNRAEMITAIMTIEQAKTGEQQ